MADVWSLHSEAFPLDWASERLHNAAMCPPGPLRRNRPDKVQSAARHCRELASSKISYRAPG
jgi:hypothetical protein